MQVTIRQNPSFSVARIQLAGGEAVQVESGAMMAMSTGVNLAAKAEGGVMKSLKRAALGGESLFVSTYTAPASGGFVDVAARLPGDMTVQAISSAMPLFISRGSWLANEKSVVLDTQWGGFKNMFGSEGGFILRAEGDGLVVFGCYGGLEEWNLAAGESITFDSGHMVAYDASVSMSIRKATGGIVQMFKSGEGLVLDFQGPGRVWTQTRNPQELIGWISSVLPTSQPGAGGVLGGILGRN
ncbi:MAG: hypothetical protein RJB08_890 [Actinomycetota bacterium]|jgi:uncharacterized protein (TIGR00266 family)